MNKDTEDLLRYFLTAVADGIGWNPDYETSAESLIRIANALERIASAQESKGLLLGQQR